MLDRKSIQNNPDLWMLDRVSKLLTQHWRVKYRFYF